MKTNFNLKELKRKKIGHKDSYIGNTFILPDGKEIDVIDTISMQGETVNVIQFRSGDEFITLTMNELEQLTKWSKKWFKRRNKE